MIDLWRILFLRLNGRWLDYLFFFFTRGAQELIFKASKIKVKVVPRLVEINRDIIFTGERSFIVKLRVLYHLKVLEMRVKLILRRNRNLFFSIWSQSQYLLSRHTLVLNRIDHTIQPHFLVFWLLSLHHLRRRVRHSWSSRAACIKSLHKREVPPDCRSD
jgi:hypothetical protein